MIYTDLNNLERYLGMGKHLDTAIHYIKEHSLNDLKKGRNEVDGDFAFINCFEYETLPEEKTAFEAHEKYADIHMVISGEEKMGVSDMSLMTVTANRFHRMPWSGGTLHGSDTGKGTDRISGRCT